MLFGQQGHLFLNQSGDVSRAGWIAYPDCLGSGIYIDRIGEWPRRQFLEIGVIQEFFPEAEAFGEQIGIEVSQFLLIILQEGHGLLPWRWAKSRLNKSHNYWLATTRPNGAPHVMPVWGLWLDEFFYFSTGAKSRKARNLAANSHCVICTENAAQAVILEGRTKKFSLRRNRAFFKRFVADYKKKYNWKIDGSEANQRILRSGSPLSAR